MSSTKVIRNTDKLLGEIMKNILPATSKVDILVGFFYFSGFKGLYKELENKKVRILVGMNAEISIVNSVVSINEKDFKIATKSELMTQLKDVFNKTETLDSLEGFEAVNVYIKKIIDGTLEIRKTIEPNHEKLYLFHHEGKFSQGGTFPGTVISGSSNLTYSGLGGRRERNTIERDSDVFLDDLEEFEDIWNNFSIPITSGGKDDELIKVLKNETWLKLTKPYYCYIRLLSEYFQEEEAIKTPKNLTGEKFINLEYQIDAIKKGMKIINEHNGVLIADVVGLGKSIIGSSLLSNIDKKAIIIAPPHLTDQWNDYKKDFDIQAEIFSSGSINKALEYDETDIHKAGVILIDEAHKYRNAYTNDYGYLHQLCQGKKVILLTATPFNNEPDDIFNLIKLFQIPGNPTIHTPKGLMEDFKSLQNEYKKIKKSQKKSSSDDMDISEEIRKLSNKIRQIIGPVVVRRSRVDLGDIDAYATDLEKQGYEISDVEDPKELNFDLGELKNLYIDTLDSLVENNDDGSPKYFIGARYNVFKYLLNPEEYQRKIEDTLGYDYILLEGRFKNMPFFIRRLLVARFESSIYSFKRTLKSIIGSIDNIFNYLDLLGGVPIIKKGQLPDLDVVFEDDDFLKEETIEKTKELIKTKDGILILNKDLSDDFIRDLESDREFLSNLLQEWEEKSQDPKLDNFKDKIKKLQSENPDRKIVVFSMFADTINYLGNNLGDKVLQVTGKQKTQTIKNHIKYNFDAGVPEDKQENDYDILLGTDAISEGYNLHRAGIIINYDIPYNPTKVIQRIGRINRINKKVFDKLYIYNYFPSIIGEEHTSIKQISTLKIKMIATVLGIDVKTLTGDEEIGSFYKKVIEEDKTTNEGKSWDTEFLNDFKNAQEIDKNILDKIQNIPQRTRILRLEKKGVKGVLLFAKKRSNLIFYFYDIAKKESIPLLPEEAFHLFKANITEKPEEVTKKFYSLYDNLKSDIRSPAIISNNNRQQKQVLKVVDNLYQETEEQYFSLLTKVIKLGGLPSVYMRAIRKITKDNWKIEIINLKKLVNEEYLKNIVEMSEDFSEETLDLIISEEFN